MPSPDFEQIHPPSGEGPARDGSARESPTARGSMREGPAREGIVQLLYNESPDAWRRILYVAGLAGIGNAAVLGIINKGAAMASDQGGMAGLRLLALFGLAIVAYYLGKRYALIRASVIVEHLVKNTLQRVANKIRHSELELVENLGRGELYTKITQDMTLVSQSGLIMVNAAQQSFVLLFCLIYIAWLSVPAFLATAAVIGIGTQIYFRHAQRMGALMARLSLRDAEMVDTLAHMVDGFKEMRMNHRKSNAVYGRFRGVSESACDVKIDTQIGFCVDIMFSDLSFYLLLSVVVFLLPRFVPMYGDVVLMTTAAILFIIGPLQMVVQAAPVFERASAALANLKSLEWRLDRAMKAPPTAGPRAPRNFENFQSIRLENACFTYGSDEGIEGGFSVGPLEMSIERGETVFIVGGNGSGKTTMMKLLCGLYLPQRGALRVDGEPLGWHSVQGYRELFSIVFAQFHLFDRLYGLEQADPKLVEEILMELEIAGKTHFEDGRFTELNLSTGQRKRVALAVCLLEDKPVVLFDEWAADQDPHFRKYFYEVVLARLKRQGKTVIAVTHDDRYFGVADRVLKMEYGTIVEEKLAGR